MTAQELAEKIADAIVGTASSLSSYIDDYPEIDYSEIEDALCGLNVERCKGCDWWHESSELDGGDDDRWVGYCDDCRPQIEE